MTLRLFELRSKDNQEQIGEMYRLTQSFINNFSLIGVKN